MTDTSSTGRKQEHERMDREEQRINEEVRSRDECLWCDGDVGDDDHDWKYVQAGGVLEGPFCSERCHWMWFHSPSDRSDITQRKCPFKGCDWSHKYHEGEYHEELDADAAAERHYEREHAGKVRTRVVLESEQLIGDRKPQEVADELHRKWEDKSGMEVAWTQVEVLEEADDHDRVVD